MSKLLIDGRWVDGGEPSQVLNDKYTGRSYGEMAVASDAQVTQAVGAAHAAVAASTL